MSKLVKTIIMKNKEIIGIYGMNDIQIHDKDCKITTESLKDRFIFISGNFSIETIDDSCIIKVCDKYDISFEPFTQQYRESSNFIECANNINKKCVISGQSCSHVISCNIKLRRIYPGKYKWLETCYTCKFKKMVSATTIRKDGKGRYYNSGHVLLCTNPKRKELSCVKKNSDNPKRKHLILNSLPNHVLCEGYQTE